MGSLDVLSDHVSDRDQLGQRRAALEDRRRFDTTTSDQTERAVVVDAVISGAIARYGMRHAAGVYNRFHWQYALPAVPYAANRMTQNGRSFLFSLTATRGAACPTV